jgi:acylphosphatase
MNEGNGRYGMGQEERGYRVRGRVQGVGFRWWTRSRADALGVTGSVENLPDGSVRVMARASAEVLELFERELMEGPSVARVEGLEVVPVELSADASGFQILR